MLGYDERAESITGEYVPSKIWLEVPWKWYFYGEYDAFLPDSSSFRVLSIYKRRDGG